MDKLNSKQLAKIADLGGGFGFLGHDIRSPGYHERNMPEGSKFSGYKLAEMVDKAYIKAAEDAGLDLAAAAFYGDSNPARHDSDDLTGKLTAKLNSELSEKGLMEYLVSFFSQKMDKFYKSIEDSEFDEGYADWCEKLGCKLGEE